MSKQWHKGPPPSVGWWPASVCKDPDCLRWWNGSRWSVAVYKGVPEERIKPLASKPSVGSDRVMWTERPTSWPERSYT